eukprot:4496364-Pyramimonas_sp.AAC.1
MDPSASKPPPRTPGDVGPQPHEDDSDDDGPGRIVVDDVPAMPDGRGPQRDSQPDNDPKQKLGLAHTDHR